jgi:hypothetical protein
MAACDISDACVGLLQLYQGLERRVDRGRGGVQVVALVDCIGGLNC